MVKKRIVVKSARGLHAKPAAELARVAKLFDGSIMLIYGDKVANLKNVFDIILLEARQGAEVIIQVNGDGEEEVIREIVSIFENILD